ncbi:adenylyltransferase/cytidyltransferase family protein [Streptomyces sp.]|uniref:adenylyltransferase/cytidyltransferase family protein n=1 Tax=Streptomyces sp. TaxID=1931 RepID=UPI0039C92543
MRNVINIGYSSGVFDLFHIGHLNILRRAKLACDYLIASVLSDEVAFEVKGRRPVVPFEERLEIVRALAPVDAAVGEFTTDKMQMWAQLGFTTMFKGNDWKGTPRALRWEAQFAEVGVEVVYLPYTEHTSSTRLRTIIDERTASEG